MQKKKAATTKRPKAGAGMIAKHKRLAKAREAGMGKGPRSQYWGSTLKKGKR
jgi:hypothetical protein